MEKKKRKYILFLGNTFSLNEVVLFFDSFPGGKICDGEIWVNYTKCPDLEIWALKFSHKTSLVGEIILAIYTFKTNY